MKLVILRLETGVEGSRADIILIPIRPLVTRTSMIRTVCKSHNMMAIGSDLRTFATQIDSLLKSHMV